MFRMVAEKTLPLYFVLVIAIAIAIAKQIK